MKKKHYNKKGVTTTSIPIELVRLEGNSFHIIIPVEIDGIRGDMILDTGASVTVIDQNLLPEKDTGKSWGTLQSGSVTGQIGHVRIHKAEYLKIGNRKFKNLQLAGIDLQYVNGMYHEHLNRRVLGLLGCDFCVRHQVQLDFKKKRLLLQA